MWCSWYASAVPDPTAAPFSSPAHFRNCYLVPSALAPDPVSRDDERRHSMGGTGLNSTRTKKLIAPAVVLLLSASLSAQATAQTPAQAPVPAPRTASHPIAKTHRVSHHPGKKSRKPRGQQAIDGERARQIQAALIRERYLNGEPSGKWDDSTQAAMRRYQTDQGWQSKSIPDSRALIRLGLGPDHVHLLNPESAMVSEPQLSNTSRAAATVAARPSVPAKASTPVAVPATTVPDISPSH